MARPGNSPKSPPENQLLVEGKDDLHVLMALFQHHALPERFAVKELSGYEQTVEAGDESFAQLIKVGNQRRLGLVVDADTNLQARWDSLVHLLRVRGYTQIPSKPDSAGTIIPPDVADDDNTSPPYKPLIGIWLMPDNQLPGALEEFARFLVPPDKKDLWDYAEASVAGLPQKPDPCTENWLAKARIQTYLAWHKRPGVPMGLAITERYLSADAAIVLPFIAWIQRLFDLAPESVPPASITSTPPTPG